MSGLRTLLKSNSSEMPSTNENKLEELYKELCIMKQKNFLLKEANQELQASLLRIGFEKGQLLSNDNNVRNIEEMETMTKEEVSIVFILVILQEVP